MIIPKFNGVSLKAIQPIIKKEYILLQTILSTGNKVYRQNANNIENNEIKVRPCLALSLSNKYTKAKLFNMILFILSSTSKAFNREML